MEIFKVQHFIFNLKKILMREEVGFWGVGMCFFQEKISVFPEIKLCAGLSLQVSWFNLVGFLKGIK